MSRKYRYSNTKFWLLISASCCMVIFSSTYHLYSLSIYAKQFNESFNVSLSLLFKTTHSTLITQKKESLTGLSNNTIGKLQFIDTSSSSINKWLQSSYLFFLQQQPLMRTIALYSPGGERIFQVGESDERCLNQIFQFDGFCVDNHAPAIRVSIPVYTMSPSPQQRKGSMSTIVLLTPREIHDVEKNFGMTLYVTAQQKPLYVSTPFPPTPDNFQIHAPAMSQHVLRKRPSLIWQNLTLYLVYTIRLGRDADSIVIQAARPANFFLWKLTEMLLMNGLLLLMIGFFFSYFHINYKFISHTYRAVIDGMADWLAFKSKDGTYQIINSTMARTLFDLHPKEVIGHTDAQLMPANEFVEQCTESDQQVIQTQERVRIIEAGITKGGQFVVMDVLKTPMYTEHGRLNGVIVCGRDISEQQKLQEALDSLEESYFSSEWVLSKLLQTMPEFIYVKDLQHRFVRASFSISEFYGEGNVIGKTDFDMLPPEQAKVFWQDEELLLSGKQEGVMKQDQVVDRHGHICHILTTKMIFRDKHGKIAGILGVGRDISALVDKQTALEFALQDQTMQVQQQLSRRKPKTESI